MPIYDFATHCRRRGSKPVGPKPIILVDGLWLLRRPSLRRLVTFSIFLDCATPLRLRRRLARDQLSRGRSAASVTKQFWTAVEPMHARFVAPQTRWADLVLGKNYSHQEVEQIAAYLRKSASGSQSHRYRVI
jgi:uridine kinase